MGSSKSSSNATTRTSTTTTTKNLNITDNEGLTVISDKEINLTDGNAFALAAEVTTAAINAISEANRDALTGAKDFAERERGELIDFASASMQPDQGLTEKVVKFGALAAVAIAGIIMVKG